jgi:hypothetical protein
MLATDPNIEIACVVVAQIEQAAVGIAKPVG